MSELVKNRMMTPGPTDVPAPVLLAGAAPQIHHRSPQFQAVYEEVLSLLGMVFRTARPVFPLLASGTGAMECCVANLAPAGSRPLVVNAGWFGKRWNDICLAHGLETDVVEAPWGTAVEPSAVEERLAANPDCPAVFVQLCETSTGAVHPVKELQAICSRTKALLVVDAISGLGADPCATDDWNLDCVIAGGQKSFMIPPGLSYVTVGERCWPAIESCANPRFYFDLRKYRDGHRKASHPFTPPTSLLRSQLEALRMIRSEGMDAVNVRHAKLAKATRAAMAALGLELFARTPGNALTPVVMPGGRDAGPLVKKARDEYGVTLAGAQGPYKGKFFRIGHLGYVDGNDIIAAVACVERVLDELGVPVKVGAGVTAAQESLIESRKESGS